MLASCFVVSGLLLACAGRHPVTSNSLAEATPDSVAPPEPIVLEVENHNWADVVLYVVHDGVQTRFAQVAAAHKLSVEIPPRLQGQMGVIRIAARRIGGTDSYVSQALSIRGSSAVRVTIESSLNHSSVGVW
jgi:type IV pilus biogenesis protein CpaD/CtpE